MSRARQLARKRAVQALYMWQMSGYDMPELDTQFVLDSDAAKVDLEYFLTLLKDIPARVAELDALISPQLDRNFSELDPVERAILRLGVYELKCRLDVPYKVVLNEAIELAKTFGAEQSHKYINGILDILAKTLRAVEFQALQKKKSP